MDLGFEKAGFTTLIPLFWIDARKAFEPGTIRRWCSLCRLPNQLRLCGLHVVHEMKMDGFFFW